MYSRKGMSCNGLAKVDQRVNPLEITRPRNHSQSDSI